MTREQVDEWIRRYERAWRTAGTEALRELFTEGATYRFSLYRDPVVGLEEIGAMWERERAGPDNGVRDDQRRLRRRRRPRRAAVEVDYGDSARLEFLDVWLLPFEGRCAHFQEWAY